MTPEDQAIWERYWDTRRDEDRNRLIERYHRLVKHQALRIGSRLSASVEVEDLESEGLFGLIDAIRGFDRSRGVKFESYAAHRIRGAIMDAVRKNDWVPRLVRVRAKKLESIAERFRQQEGREPAPFELQRAMGLSDAEFDRLFGDSRVVRNVSLQTKLFETDNLKEIDLGTLLSPAKQQPCPADRLESQDLVDSLVGQLGGDEKIIVCLYDLHRLTMKQVACVLRLSESRISQRHTEVLQTLRAMAVRAEEGPSSHRHRIRLRRRTITV